MTMEQALQALSRDDVLAAIRAKGSEIGPGERFACLYQGQRFDPKQLLAIALQLTTGQLLATQTLQDATYAPFEQLLNELEFSVVKIPRALGDDSLTVMLYEVKRPDVVQGNFQRLLSGNQKRFYWSQEKFTELKKGAPVFVVNSSAGKVLFGYLQTTHIKATYHAEKNTSTFTDLGETFEVSGAWEEFVCLDIRYIQHTPLHWRWKTLGSGEHTYLSGSDISASSARNNLERVNLLLEVFTDENSDVGLQLHTCFGVLQNIVPEKLATKEREPSIWYVMQGRTFNPDQGQKFLWAPTLDKRGGTPKHWAAMADLTPGDIIIHSTNGGIKGVSRVTSLPIACDMPFEDEEWRGEGLKADVEMLVFIDPPITVDTLRRLQRPLESALADVRGPFNRHGTGNQGYLFEFTWEALAILLGDRSIDLPADIKNWLPDIELPEFTEDQPKLELVRSKPVETTQLLSKDWLPAVQSAMSQQGFNYSLAEIANFYLSLRTKPLVLLAGISGTGKTQLVRQFARAIGYGDSDHCVLIPVRPDWSDSSDLIGYENIQGNFISQPFLNVLKRAMAHPDELYFVILDEMNLARVEHYFAEYLSIIETRQRNSDAVVVTDPLLNRADVNDGLPVVIPQNLMVVGTVNMDETTHPFSRKVLDRANAIEMNDIDLSWADSAAQHDALRGIYADTLVSPFLNAKDLTNQQKAVLSDALSLLMKVNDALEPAGLHFGYRVRDEVAFYLTLRHAEALDAIGFSSDDALDFQLMQKVLPRIQGSSMAVFSALVQLLNLLAKTEVSPDADIPDIAKAIAAAETRYPRSVKKLLFMLQRFNNDGFTSFWL